MDRSRVGIVIPALNEANTIQGVVKAAENYGNPIVVDDGSNDNTSEIAKGAGAVVISHSQNKGYDEAIDSGFKKAAEMNIDIIITLDADGQHDPSLIQKFIDLIDAGSDVVVGMRDTRARFSEHLFAWYTNYCFGIKDPLCGMKAYRKEVYESLGHFDSYGSIGTELTIFAAKNNFRIKQLLITVHERSGQSRFGQILSGNYKIMRAMIFSFWRVKKISPLSHRN